MVRPNKKKLEKLKQQDKELAKLPSMEEEKKKFKKGESMLERWSRKSKLAISLKKLKREKSSQMKSIKKQVKRKKSLILAFGREPKRLQQAFSSGICNRVKAFQSCSRPAVSSWRAFAGFCWPAAFRYPSTHPCACRKSRITCVAKLPSSEMLAPSS